MTGARRAAWLAVATAASMAAPAVAQEIPKGRIGGFVGGRENVGDLRDTFQRGFLFGFSAGYQPARLGLEWSIVFGFFNTDKADAADDTLRPRELQFGLRFAQPIFDSEHRSISVSAGATLLRSNIPVPPDDERLYIGPYGGLGFESLVGKYLLTIEARYGLIIGGPAGVTMLFGVARGT